MSNDYKDLKVKMQASSAICFVGSIFFYSGALGGDPEFGSKLAVLFLFGGVLTLALGIIYGLFTSGGSRPSSEPQSPLWMILALLSGIAAIITIAGALNSF